MKRRRQGRDNPIDTCPDCGVNLHYGPHRLGCEVLAAELQDHADEAWEREAER